jgi:hypothetical protein
MKRAIKFVQKNTPQSMDDEMGNILKGFTTSKASKARAEARAYMKEKIQKP